MSELRDLKLRNLNLEGFEAPSTLTSSSSSGSGDYLAENFTKCSKCNLYYRKTLYSRCPNCYPTVGSPIGDNSGVNNLGSDSGKGSGMLWGPLVWGQSLENFCPSYGNFEYGSGIRGCGTFSTSSNMEDGEQLINVPSDAVAVEFACISNTTDGFGLHFFGVSMCTEKAFSFNGDPVAYGRVPLTGSAKALLCYRSNDYQGGRVYWRFAYYKTGSGSGSGSGLGSGFGSGR